jgi:hypothetical protein
MGFGIKWRNLILEFLSQSRPAILINGSPSREFGVQRGLKQGDCHGVIFRSRINPCSSLVPR